MAHGDKEFKARGGSSVNRLSLLCPPSNTWNMQRVKLLHLLSILAASLVILSWGLVEAQESQPIDPPPPPTVHQEHIVHIQESTRDSLVVEIRKYSQMISSMRDSLSLAELGLGLELDTEGRAHLENSIHDVTLLIEEIGSELGQLDLEISENRITLLDAEGEGIIINIPENLDEQLSQGLNVLSQLILSELPDSVQFDKDFGEGWQGISFNPFDKKKKEKRKVIKGNIVKVWDRLQVTELEDVRGHVVVVFGDAEVSGRVDGNVVVVFGDLQLTESAEVTGEVVAIGGRLDQDPDAEVADVLVVDPWRSLGTDGPEGFLNPGPLNFLLGQGEFLAMVLFSFLAFGLAPVKRLDRSLDILSRRPLPSLGAGLVASMGLHILAILIMSILVLTLIGIPVALLVAVALVVVGVLSVGLVALALGRQVCQRFSGKCGSTWGSVIIGLIILHFVSFCGGLLGIWSELSGISLLLVVLGTSIKLGAYFFGLGALALGRFGSARSASAPDTSA